MRLPPRAGWRAWVEDENLLLVYDGFDWVGTTPAEFQDLALLGLGTTADAANPFSAKLNAALWTARTAAEGGDGDLRYTLNKEGASDVLYLLLQSGFSARADPGIHQINLRTALGGAPCNRGRARRRDPVVSSQPAPCRRARRPNVRTPEFRGENQ
jgi:hypothetical protein